MDITYGEFLSWWTEDMADPNDTDGPVFVEANFDPPKPPYGSPERAAYDAANGGEAP